MEGVRSLVIRSVLCCALLAALALGAGCSPSGAPLASPAAEDGAQKVYEEKLVISANIQDAEAVPGTALWDYFQEKFNVEFDLLSMSFNERHEMARIWVSSGSMPDLLWMDLDETMFAEYANWALQDMFQAYPTMEELEARWPHIAAIYQMEGNIADELMTIDGQLYAHPMLRDNPEYNYMSSMCWMYRRDWAMELGLYKEDDIYTWDEWVELNRAFVEQDPGGNGPGRTVGMGTEIFYFPYAMGIYQTSAEYGYGAFSPQDGQYVWTAARPETLEGLQIVKQLFDEGIIWQDNPLGQLPDDMYEAGLMGSDFNNFNISRLYSVRKALKENFPDIDENDAGALAKVIGPDGTFWCKQSQCYWGAVLMAADIGTAKMERWLDMLDWMLTEEGIYFRAYGIQGKDWRYDENGDVECLWPASTVLEGTLTDPYPEGSRIFFLRYCDAFSQTDAPNYAYPQAYIDDVEAYYSFMRDYGFMRTFDYESSYLSAEHKNQTGDLQNRVSEKMIELVTGASAEALPILWTEWIDSMEPTVQPVLDELNTLIENVPQEAQPVPYVP